MSVVRRRGLLVDDPLVAREDRSPTAPPTGSAEIAGRLRDIPCQPSMRIRLSLASASMSRRWPRWRTRSAREVCCSL
jgi:hypothetical protein